MLNKGLQLQRRSGGVVRAYNNVFFDTLIMGLLDVVNYDYKLGRIIIKKVGKYYIDWWINVDIPTVVPMAFSISTVDGKLIPENIKQRTGRIIGRAFINVEKVPMTLLLVNTRAKDVNYASRTPIKASLTIQQLVQVGEDLGGGENLINQGIKNLVDGNAVGSVRGINTAIGYTMGISSMAIGNNTVASGDNSFASGDGAKASGNQSRAEGYITLASGYASHAEGDRSLAISTGSHAEGWRTKASNNQSHAEGEGSEASGYQSHAEGHYTLASGEISHAEGRNTIGSGQQSHAEGLSTKASGIQSHAEGAGSVASGQQSHAEGYYATASGDYSHAEGNKTIASNNHSHAEGKETVASGQQSHAEGAYTIASGTVSHAEGTGSIASALGSHAEGGNTKAMGQFSHAEGYYTTSSGFISHAEGYYTIASGSYSHAEGTGSIASITGSHAEGGNTKAMGQFSHAEGYSTTASGVASHAEGGNTKASGIVAHAEGYNTKATGDYSHVEGVNSEASGIIAHAEGGATIASGDYSHAEGLSTDTKNYQGAHIMGQYGEATEKYSWFIGNGTPTNSSIGAKWLSSTKSFYASGYVTTGADYAEYFESVDGNAIDVGYFVTFEDGEKIRIANECDNYILGIVSSNPGVIGNSSEFNWKDKYLSDEWGRVIYEDVLVPKVITKDGIVISKEHKEKQPIINPEYNYKQEYIPRRNREEWIPVGLLGKLRVRDNGNCMVNGYCKVGDGGIAIPSDSGYRVLQRTGEKQIIIFFTVSVNHKDIEEINETLEYYIEFINKIKNK